MFERASISLLNVLSSAAGCDKNCECYCLLFVCKIFVEWFGHLVCCTGKNCACAQQQLLVCFHVQSLFMFVRSVTKQGPLSSTPPSGVGKFCIRWPLGLNRIFVLMFFELLVEPFYLKKRFWFEPGLNSQIIQSRLSFRLLVKCP